MLNFAGFVAVTLALWHGWDHEWLEAGAWTVAAVALALASAWWRSALRAWRTDR